MKARALVHRLGLIALAIAAVVTVSLGTPTVDSSSSALDNYYPTTVESALVDYEGNEDLAEGAPQQAVVAGWVNRDLLAIIAAQGADDRIPVLLMLAILTLVWNHLLAPSGRTEPPVASVEPLPFPAAGR